MQQSWPRQGRWWRLILIFATFCCVTMMYHEAVSMAMNRVANAASPKRPRETENLIGETATRRQQERENLIGESSPRRTIKTENLFGDTSATRQQERDTLIGESSPRRPCERENLIAENKSGIPKGTDDKNETQSMFADDKRRIHIDGDFCLEQSLIGSVFREGNTEVVQDKIKICHIKTFENSIAEDAKKDFPYLNEAARIRLLSPSLMWFRDELVITLRLRLSQTPSCWGFICNHLYVRRYDRYLNPVGQRELTTLRTPRGPDNRKKSGPQDPRVFQINNSMYNLFSMEYKKGLLSGVWDYQKQRQYLPEFQKVVLQRKGITHEKNWVPLVIRDELYIIRHLDPLLINKCKIHEDCSFVGNESFALQYEMDDAKTPLRGGTGFELYQYPYYIGMAHGTYIAGHHSRYYKVHLLVLCVDPFRIVYVSDPLEVHQALSDKFRNLERAWDVVKGDFIFPTGILIESEDSVVIGAHINDEAAILLRMEGIKSVVQSVIKADQGNSYQPPAMFIQNYLRKRAGLV